MLKVRARKPFTAIICALLGIICLMQSKAQEPLQPRTEWWRPLTNRWGLLGIIVFFGLVKVGIDGVVVS